MKLLLKVVLVAFFLPVIATSGIALYWYLTYIDTTHTSGSAWGYEIGASKENVINQIKSQLSDYPNLHVYVSYGPRAGDNFSIHASKEFKHKLQFHDRWDLLLDGESDFFNSIDLYFKNNKLEKIHRHRQYFEFP